VSPMISGIIASVSIRTVFVCDVAVMIALGLSVRRLMTDLIHPSIVEAAEYA
jgi:hypothetical protein